MSHWERNKPVEPQPQLLRDINGAPARAYDEAGCSCDPDYYLAHLDAGCPLNWRQKGLARGCVPTMVNGRWELLLPPHRAARPEWPWWEATRLAAMRTVIGPESVVYDVGAEEGDFPALWASWGAQVVLAEPNRRVWPNIKLVFEANGLPMPAGTWVGFLADKVSLACHMHPGEWPDCANGPVIGDHGFMQWGERPDVASTTLDQLRTDGGMPPPTVITMDVEGSELHVLRGAAECLARFRPEVFVSIHPEFMHHHYGQELGMVEPNDHAALVTNATSLVRNFMADMGYAYDRHIFLAHDHEWHWWFQP